MDVRNQKQSQELVCPFFNWLVQYERRDDRKCKSTKFAMLRCPSLVPISVCLCACQASNGKANFGDVQSARATMLPVRQAVSLSNRLGCCKPTCTDNGCWIANKQTHICTPPQPRSLGQTSPSPTALLETGDVATMGAESKGQADYFLGQECHFLHDCCGSSDDPQSTDWRRSGFGICHLGCRRVAERSAHP